MRLALLDRLLALRQAGQPTALLTDLGSGAQGLLGDPAADPASVIQALALAPADLAQIGQALSEDRSRAIEREAGGTLFVEVWNPPARLFVVGGVHIAQALIPMARMLGYQVLLIDPRSRFASPTRFPDVAISNDWPDDVLAGAALDKRSAVVTLTHDPKIDDPGLAAALRTEAFYVGALGSRRTHAGRVARLAETGFSPADIARVRGPVGLAIGAITPAEVAISILAEMTGALHGKDLRERPSA